MAYCCLAVLVALYVVGAVSHGSLRHEVQTLPLWIPIVLGFRDHELAKWFALPCLIFWIGIVVFIWLFLLGWARIVTGHYSPTEILMTLVIGAACLFGTVTSIRWRTTLRPLPVVATTVLSAILQIVSFRVSLLPNIANQ